jgi:hypothetical protein
MKIDPSLAYRNFVDTCRSEATRRVYIKALHYFMGYLRLPLQAYDKLLDKDPNPYIIEREIECPRCYDVMALSSEFDKLLYFCQECGLSLVMK